MDRKEDRRKRVLTDDDVEAIAEALKLRIKQEFYQDLGRGVWGFVWKLFISTTIAIAAYGAYNSGLTK